MGEHLSRELFRAISQGWRDPGDLAAIAMAHLFELCPHCRREFDEWREEAEDGRNATDGGDFDAVLDRMRASERPADGKGPVAGRTVQQAEIRAVQLLALTPAQQADWIRAESHEHSCTALADGLIKLCRLRTPGSPHEGMKLANLARLVLHHAPTVNETTALYARSLAHLANATRVVGDLPRADQIFGDARYFLRSQGGGERLFRAELDRLEGSLRTSQESPNEAISLLLRALMTYRMEGARSEAAAVLIQLARAHHRQGASDWALSLLKEATEILQPEDAPRLRLLSRENAVLYLCTKGETQHAMEVFEQTRDLAAELGDPLHLLRRTWAAGLVSRARMDLDKAERRLLHVRDGFDQGGLKHDQALVSLDLATLYAEEGMHHDAEELVESVLPTFQELGLPGRVEEARLLLGRHAIGY